MNDDWQQWGGGICPVDTDRLVSYRLRMGWECDAPTPAGILRWDHGRTPGAALDESLRRNDIVAYRLDSRECRECCGNGQTIGKNSGEDIICPICKGTGWTERDDTLSSSPRMMRAGEL